MSDIKTDFGIRTGIGVAGVGVFAERLFRADERIGYLDGVPVENPTRHSVQCDGVHIEPTSALRFLNHACSPNARFDSRWLLATRRIDADEEITIDYRATEDVITHSFTCNCGCAGCAGPL